MLKPGGTERIEGFRCRCARCDYTWISVGAAKPERCASCGSPYWRIVPGAGRPRGRPSKATQEAAEKTRRELVEAFEREMPNCDLLAVPMKNGLGWNVYVAPRDTRDGVVDFRCVVEAMDLESMGVRKAVRESLKVSRLTR